jgi:hypothetical protein
MDKKNLIYIGIGGLIVALVIYYMYFKKSSEEQSNKPKRSQKHIHGLTDSEIQTIIQEAKPKIQSEIDSLPETATGDEDTINSIMSWTLNKLIKENTIGKIKSEIVSYIRNNYKTELTS